MGSSLLSLTRKGSIQRHAHTALWAAAAVSLLTCTLQASAVGSAGFCSDADTTAGGLPEVDGVDAGLAASAFAAGGLLASVFSGSEDLPGVGTTAAVVGWLARCSASAST